MSPLKVFMNSPPAGGSVYAPRAQTFSTLSATKWIKMPGWLAPLPYVANMPFAKGATPSLKATLRSSFTLIS